MDTPLLPEFASHPSARTQDIAELCVSYVLILAVVWTPHPIQGVLYWITVAWILITGWLGRNRSRPIGFGLHGLRRSLWIPLAALALFFFGIEMAARMGALHKLYGPLPFSLHILEYAVWALMQQYILQVYVLLRLLRLGFGRPAAIGLAALLFAIAHIPNPVLVPAVLLWGSASCWLYLRYRNLYPLAIAHGLLGMCLAVCVPNSLNHHMRVGLGYVEYPNHRSGLEMNDR